MSKKIVALVLMVAMMAALFAGCASTSTTAAPTTAAPAETTAAPAATTAAPADKTFTVGFAMSEFDDKWLTYLREAAVAKAKELGVELLMVDGKNDVSVQLGLVENFCTQGVDAIIVVPVNTDATDAMSKAAQAANIPLIAVNRIFKDEGGYTAYVGSDSIFAGKLQADFVGEALGGKGNVVIMRGQDGQEAAAMRTQGNLDELTAKYPDIKVIENDTAAWDRAKGMALAENWLNKHGEDINAFLCNNDEMAIGSAKAIANAGLTGKIIVVGVDASLDGLAALKNDEINFTVFQDAKGQGAGAVQTALDILQGKSVEKTVWIPYQPVVKADADKFIALQQ